MSRREDFNYEDNQSPLAGGEDIDVGSADASVSGSRAVLVTAAGDLAIVFADGSEVVVPVSENTLYPFRMDTVKTSGTTALGIKVFY